MVARARSRTVSGFRFSGNPATATFCLSVPARSTAIYSRARSARLLRPNIEKQRPKKLGGGDPIFETELRSAGFWGIDVTLVESGRLPADQSGDTAFALSGQFPIAPPDIEQTQARDSGLVALVSELSQQERLRGHGTPAQEPSRA